MSARNAAQKASSALSFPGQTKDVTDPRGLEGEGHCQNHCLVQREVLLGTGAMSAGDYSRRLPAQLLLVAVAWLQEHDRGRLPARQYGAQGAQMQLTRIEVHDPGKQQSEKYRQIDEGRQNFVSFRFY